VAPIVEQHRREPGALDALEKLLRDDLVGVDIDARQGRDPAVVPDEGRHVQLRMSTRCPAIPAAAAMAGLIRCVRPPRPWRPSKLRFDVAAQRSPLARMSGFMPRHIEHPELRHSNPAARNTRSSPSASACALTCCDPGTTSARTPAATRRPRTTPAALRRSSIRALVHEPRNTRLIANPSSGVPGCKSMYASARWTASRSAAMAKPAGSGTRAVMSATMPGFVPHVT